MENDRVALAILRGNIAACGAEERTRVVGADARRPPAGSPCTLVLLDPPYGQGLAGAALAALRAAGWLAAGALVVLEQGQEEVVPEVGTVLAGSVPGWRRWWFSGCRISGGRRGLRFRRG